MRSDSMLPNIFRSFLKIMASNFSTTFHVESEEVLYTDQTITCVDRPFLEMLKTRAMETERKRIRLCTHANLEDGLHEMLIVLHRDTYVPPHAHQGKSESYHLIEGGLDVVIFQDDGTPDLVIPLSVDGQGGFYYRLSEQRFHTVLVKSEWVVFHETTNGPFRRENTVFPSWAPGQGDDPLLQQRYLDGLRKMFFS
jgi:cupin fold WbuC family metalloprotein